MLKLQVVQAAYGDCFILEYGTPASPRYTLIDGGPATVYEDHLRPKLAEIQAGGGGLDLAVLSHVDDDHIVGLLALLKELAQQRAEHTPETIGLTRLWHNTFSQTLGKDIEDQFRTGQPAPGLIGGAPGKTARRERSIGQGDALTQAARTLAIPINPDFTPGRLICQDQAPAEIRLDNLSLRIVGPTTKNLKRLRTEWLAWLKARAERKPARGRRALAEKAVLEADQSVPNLSSVMFLAQADGQTILFTGDGRAADLLQGLRQAGLLDAEGRLHVNVLKLPHHGSERNVTLAFFKAVTADRYIISANGQNGNPDLNTLKWVVKAAKAAKRQIELVVTNPTDSIGQLVEACPPSTYGYHLTQMEPGAHALALELARN